MHSTKTIENIKKWNNSIQRKTQKQHDNIKLLNPFEFKFLDKGNNSDLKYQSIYIYIWKRFTSDSYTLDIDLVKKSPILPRINEW